MELLDIEVHFIHCQQRRKPLAHYRKRNGSECKLFFQFCLAVFRLPISDKVRIQSSRFLFDTVLDTVTEFELVLLQIGKFSIGGGFASEVAYNMRMDVLCTVIVLE
jgi:hypothetical protein